MTSYFIKFMLLLMVTLSISQANATVVYYKNTNNWETPTAHMWNGGEGTNFPGKAMTNLGDGWYSIDAGSNKNIQFNNGSDNGKTPDLQIPQNVSATAYVDGNWETVTYKLYHPWNVDEWDLNYKIPCSGVISRPAASTSCRSFFITSAGIHLRSTLTVRTRLRLRTMSIGA